MTPPEQNFWRLFANYEDLTRNQATAIDENNFNVVVQLTATKSVILEEMGTIAAKLGLNSSHPALKSRLTGLNAMIEKNIVLISEKLARAQRDSQALETATLRLRAVEHVYRNHKPATHNAQG
jgi:hypothetical protein